jgi:hypothetical protein
VPALALLPACPPPPGGGGAGSHGVSVYIQSVARVGVNMPALDKKFFAGDPNVPAEDIVNCEVGNFREAADDVLRKFGWNGKAAGCVGLSLSPDNLRVTGGTFFIRGSSEDKEVKFPCNKIWPDADLSCTVTIRLPSLESFFFPDGGLWSDYLPGEEVVHYFHKIEDGGPPAPLLSADLREWQIGKFCIRLICSIATTSTVKKGVIFKYVVVLHPGSREEILAVSDLAQQPGWPGIKLGDGEFPAKPVPTKPWQCPVLPLIKTGTDFLSLGKAPTGEKLRHAIGSILSRAGSHETHRGVTATLEAIDRLLQNPSEGACKTPALYWPKPADLPPEGNMRIFLLLHNLPQKYCKKTRIYMVLHNTRISQCLFFKAIFY